MNFRIQIVLILWCLMTMHHIGISQSYDLILKGGKVIDPASGTNERLDVAISGTKIAAITKSIPVSEGKKVIDVSGLIVAPGLIDLHTHVFAGGKTDTFADGNLSVMADAFSFRSGVTTVVDAGTSGWNNFEKFKSDVIDKSQTRILAFLNIAGNGMSGNPEQQQLEQMDAEKTGTLIKKYPEILVGVKIGHYEGKDTSPFLKSIDAANQSGTPLFVECHLPEYSLEWQLNQMRPGDIITHSFEQVNERMTILDESGQLRNFVKSAQQNGLLFDLGHGGYGFWFNQAIGAYRQGLAPNTFGTDLHRFSMNAGMKNILNVMSKYLTMGMKQNDIIKRATWNAAQAIRRPDLGCLKVGGEADIAVLSIQKGNFGFVDAGGNRINGHKKFESELTIRSGKIMWDLNGRSATPFNK
jgi:dihydroorotase